MNRKLDWVALAILAVMVLSVAGPALARVNP
jgi:hypothetical protein